MSELERITARRSELDPVAEEPGKRLQEDQAEREDCRSPSGCCTVWPGDDRGEAEAAALVAPVKAQVARRAVLLVPHRGDQPDEAVLPDDYRRILTIARAADGPVQVRAVGEELGLEAGLRGKLEPLRAKMTKCDRIQVITCTDFDPLPAGATGTVRHWNPRHPTTRRRLARPARPPPPEARHRT